ncbi:MAG: transketolase [Elusimicrobia bacterium]|nr:transketolase [Elusimicrobiota bacterium]
MADRISELEELARFIRLTSVKMTHFASSAHVGGSLSMADLLAALYGGVLKVDPAKPKWKSRDRFILSKGHACAGLYAALARKGFFPVEWLETFYRNGGRLHGHSTHGVPGIEVSTGSLGHGLPIACGMALAAKRDRAKHRVFCLLSDGECDEGSTWEAALFAGHHGLDNLVAIVDYNKIQSLGRTKEVLDLDPFAKKWEGFRWAVREIDGHDLGLIDETLRKAPFEPGRPSCVVAHTVKGKGVSFMEDKLLWHYRNASAQEYNAAVVELEGRK